MFHGPKWQKIHCPLISRSNGFFFSFTLAQIRVASISARRIDKHLHNFHLIWTTCVYHLRSHSVRRIKLSNQSVCLLYRTQIFIYQTQLNYPILYKAICNDNIKVFHPDETISARSHFSATPPNRTIEMSSLAAALHMNTFPSLKIWRFVLHFHLLFNYFVCINISILNEYCV